MKTNKLVSVIVLNYNGKDMTIKFLESLKKTKFLDYETILVDNGSIDGCAEHVKEHFPYVKVIKNTENLGYAGGMNVGIKVSRGNYVVLMNNDMKVYPDWLGELVKVSKSDKRIGVVVPMLMQNKNIIQRVGYIENGGLLLKFRALGKGEVNNGQYKDVIEINHGNGLIKQEVFDKIGLLDEKFFVYWEETDFCYRARKAGYKVVAAPTSKVWHKGSGTMNRKSYDVIFHKHKNRIRFIMNNLGFFRKLINIPLTLFYYIWETILATYKRDFITVKAVKDSIIWNVQNFKDYI